MKYLSFRAVAIAVLFVFFGAAALVGSRSSNAEQATVEGIEITKVALLNEQPVDEVCGGQTVTFRYTLTNFEPSLPMYVVNLQDSDPLLGDIDGTVLGLTIPAGQVVTTFNKTVFIAAGQVSSGTVLVTMNYSPTRPYSTNDDDAFADSATGGVTGLFCDVNVQKRVNGAPPSGDQAFTFEIRTGASTVSNGTAIATAVANAGNGGNFNIGSGLTAGTQYQFCETNILPGWTTSLSSMAGAFVPSSANPPADNGVVCVPFTIDPEEGTVFEVNNNQELVYGPARTIGYWKNWSTCSSGRQAPVLNYVLSTFGQAPSIPQLPLPNPLPAINPGAYLGTLAQINTCEKAFNILDKSTFGGVKKAAHPAFNMAAQLLAVKLNIQAGANPRCIGPYVTEADGILTAIGFNGTTVPTYTTAQGARMNTLAGYFDGYNNGDPDLCPLP